MTGTSEVGSNTWSEDLFSSSRAFMRAALKARTKDDQALFLSNAMTALEQLSLAVLAADQPVLIVDSRDLDSLLQALGRRPLSKDSIVKTIDFSETARRVAAMHNSMSGQMIALQRLWKARNSLVHFGVHPDLREIEDTVVILHSADKLVSLLGRDRADFFTSFIDYVDVWTQQGEERYSVTARAKVVAATQRWARQTAGLEPAAVTALVSARQAQYPADIWDYDPELLAHPCPACANQACMYGFSTSELDEPPDEDFDDTRIFSPYELWCACCNLRINDYEELEAVGIPSDLAHRVRVTTEDRVRPVVDRWHL